MNIVDLYRHGDPVISFEFFPPKTDRGYHALFETIGDLKELTPGFVSMTMGAGGSTRSQTVDLVIRIERELDLTAMAHLPCLGSERAEIAQVLDDLAVAGIQNVLALRGDPPRDTTDFRHPDDGFDYASELTAFIAERGGFSIGGGCHPETHPEATSAETDLMNLKKKVDAGAQFLISQLFFDNTKFFAFVDRARAEGIQIPIVPGIMPITSVSGIRRMSALGGGTIPSELDSELSRNDEDDAAVLEIGIEWASLQCRELIEAGVPGIHFYTLNRSSATRRIHRALREAGLVQ
ncbi:MAG TPA: methylenetetrahydrofolate reductase [NAD(P)H] [Myxococcales bacterium]|nr:methylenetetrahydrofolate reductase [NAD(P)H] [Myxococcales bacterium]